jgi:GNAT superfamily N-acetyltransferase
MGRMQQSELVIRRTTEADWAEARDLRLEMVQDTPMAFGETIETALAVPESDWRMRAARGSAASSLGLAAIVDGRWVGTMGAYIPKPDGGALLVGVYVSPDFRGSAYGRSGDGGSDHGAPDIDGETTVVAPGPGVADALLSGIEEWARERGDTLTLHVHADNTRARAFYARRGFVETGVTFPYVLAPEEVELEMTKQLG